jgi:hypothetical protein
MDETCCLSGCTKLMTNPQNCGMCGRACKPEEECVGGGCMAPPGCVGCTKTCCNKMCVDTDTDASNCGTCDYKCPMGQTCMGGNCLGPPKDMGAVGDGGSECACAKKMCLFPPPIGCLQGCCLEEIIISMTCNPDPKCP